MLQEILVVGDSDNGGLKGDKWNLCGSDKKEFGHILWEVKNAHP